MTRRVADIELDVYQVGNSATDRASADATISTDIESLQIQSRVQQAIDTGAITIRNNDAQHNSQVSIGDRLELYTQLVGEASLSRRWTGLVADREFNLAGAGLSTLTLSVDDFVFGVLSRRFVTAEFNNRAVSGSSSAVVNTMLANNAPGISTSSVASVTDLMDAEYQRTNLLDAVSELAKRYDAVASADGTALSFQPRSDIDSKFVVDDGDWQGTLRVRETDEDLVNDVIVDGAREQALDIQQTTRDTFETVTDSNRRTQQVDVRKGAVASVELYVQKGAADEDLILRVQADDGNGNPREPSNATADLASGRVNPDDIPADGWVQIELPDNNLPDPNPHLIAEAGGSTGHDVGYESSTSEMAYKVDYWYPVTPHATDKSSIDAYRRQEGRYRRETIRGDAEGKDIASGVIQRRSAPTVTIPAAAKSTRMHNLSSGECVQVTLPEADVDEDFIVASVTDRYNGSRLGTRIQLTSKEAV